MNSSTYSDCDCGESCEIPDITDQQFHDCQIAENIFKQLDVTIIQKLHDTAQFTCQVNYQLFDYGAAVVTLNIKPKQDSLYKEEDIKVRTLLRDDVVLTDSDEYDYVDIDTGKIVPRPNCLQVHRKRKIEPNKNKSSRVRNKRAKTSSESESDSPDYSITDERSKKRKGKPMQYYKKFGLPCPSQIPGNHKCAYPGCDKKYSFKSALRRHISVVHKKVRFICPIPGCNTDFGQKQHLKLHIKAQHHNERPYKCPHCNESFKASYTLKCHIRTHTGEKPYVCIVCGTGFTQAGIFKIHKTKHTEQEWEKAKLGSSSLQNININNQNSNVQINHIS